MFNMLFAKNLKKIIDERNLTPKMISDATGIPRSNIGDWLAGTEPRLNDSIIKLAKYLGCSIDYLMTGKSLEEEVLNDFSNSLEDGFAEIHSGVYRLRIEKFFKK